MALPLVWDSLDNDNPVVLAAKKPVLALGAEVVVVRVRAILEFDWALKEAVALVNVLEVIMVVLLGKGADTVSSGVKTIKKSSA